MDKVDKQDLTVELLKSVLKYDPDTGYLIWIGKSHSKRIVLGSRAGSLVKSTGYRSVTVFGRAYQEHVLIWFIYYGKWPEGQVDHKDHIRDHNWISNLQDVTFLQNMRNKQAMSGTITGHQGVWFNKRRGKYVAEITMNGRKVYQKSFDSASAAATARAEELIRLGFHENHGAETPRNM